MLTVEEILEAPAKRAVAEPQRAVAPRVFLFRVLLAVAVGLAAISVFLS